MEVPARIVRRRLQDAADAKAAKTKAAPQVKCDACREHDDHGANAETETDETRPTDSDEDAESPKPKAKKPK